jgi:hypothetical protein
MTNITNILDNDKSQGKLIMVTMPVVAPRPVRLWGLVIKTPEHLEGDVIIEHQVRYFTLQGQGVSDVLDVLEQMGIDDDLLTVIEWAAVPMVLEHGEDIANLAMGHGNLKAELIELARQHGGQLTDEILDSLNPPRHEMRYAEVITFATFAESADGLGWEVDKFHSIEPPLPGVYRLAPRSLRECVTA